jgi:pyridoxamine 5'-phosphate oxidase
MAIADLRREYNLAGLRRDDLAPDPLVQFQKWFDQASGARTSGRLRRVLIRAYKALLLLGNPSTELIDINAMTLATVDAQGNPSSRIVLLKGVDQRGFIFYTNYSSRKGQELAGNGNAALTFYWPDQERQVCVAGTVTKLPAAESDAYFQSRPRGSRIGAWASDQSQPVRDRADLERRWQEIETRFANKDVTRPTHWGGYLLSPRRIEFWQGRPNRLHDRFQYVKVEGEGWRLTRLCP